MTGSRTSVLALALFGAACRAPAPDRRILYAVEQGPDAHQVRIVDRDGGEVARLGDLAHVYSARITPTGTVLATLCEDSGWPLGLAEVSRDGQVVWRYDWPEGRDEIEFMRACHVLPNGNLLIAGKRGYGAGNWFKGAVLLEMERSGAEVRRIELGPLRYLGAVRPLDDGVLVAGEGILELGWDGRRRVVVPPADETLIFDALPLADGGFIYGENARRLVAIDAHGREAWTAIHAKPVFLQLLAGGHLLAGG